MSVKFAVLGAGRIGQVHARAIASVDGASLVAVFDPFAEAAERVAQTYGCAIRSIDDIAASDDVDAVAIYGGRGPWSHGVREHEHAIGGGPFMGP